MTNPKLFFGLQIFLYSLSIVLLIIETSINAWLILGILVMAGINDIFMTKAVIKRPISGEFEIRRQRERPVYFFLVIALLLTFFELGSKQHNGFIFMLFWYYFLREVLTDQVYRKEKPVFIVINNGELIINGVWPIRRNVSTVKAITGAGMTNNIYISFSEKQNISIRIGDYYETDIVTLIDYLRKHSAHDVKIGETLRVELGLQSAVQKERVV